jgi:hypothetical protein
LALLPASIQSANEKECDSFLFRNHSAEIQKGTRHRQRIPPFRRAKQMVKWLFLWNVELGNYWCLWYSVFSSSSQDLPKLQDALLD